MKMLMGFCAKVFLGVFVGLSAQATILSWGALLESTKTPEKLADLYKLSGSELSKNKAFLAWLKSEKKNLNNIESHLQSTSRWARGEFESQAFLDRFVSLFQAHLLYARQLGQSQGPKDQILRWVWWSNYAADLAYNEASLIGLRLSSVIRNLVLDEVDRLSAEQQTRFAETAEMLNFLVQIRAPWPIDRVVISEGKRLAPPQLQKVVSDLAQELQKNPYEDLQTIMGRVKGGTSKQVLFLRQFWTDKEISRMKSELNRIGRLQLDWAQAVYKLKTKSEAQSAQELVGAGLLPRVPVDYTTGRAMSLKL
jgi:hypothetical protein